MAGLYSAPSISTLIVDQFKGVDLSVPEDQMKPYRAASCENLIPGATGEVKKRPGVQYEGTFNLSLSKKCNERVVDMIDATHPITEATVYIKENNKYVEKEIYGLYRYCDGAYRYIAYTDHKPLVFGYGKRNIALLYTNYSGIVYQTKEGYEWANVGYVGAYQFNGAMAVFDEEDLWIYLDSGLKLKRNPSGENAAYPEEPVVFTPLGYIQPDDLFLTTPIIVQGCDPAGGGSTFRQVNLLSPWVTESFCCKAAQTSVFYLNDGLPDIGYQGTDPDRWSDRITLDEFFRVEILTSFTVSEKTGETTEILRWTPRSFVDKDGYRLSANRLYLDPAGNGKVYYFEGTNNYEGTLGTGEDSWIGPTPIEGEDNVRITHWRASFTEDFRTLCACACGTVFGVGGYKDRLFLGGCQISADGHRERIYYSEMEDPFYIGDLNYIKLEDGCRVMALDGTADVLAALTDRGIYLIGAQAQQNTNDVMYVADALFTVSKKVLAPAPLHYGDTEVLGGEIVYLSEEGVVAITYKENFDERYAEHRSAMIDLLMMKDKPQQLISLGRFLMIRCEGGVWWLLDENQPNGEGNKPYSSHQYEGWRLSGMPADTAWAEGSVLHLLKGNVECIWTDGSGADHYRDSYTRDGGDAKAIAAYWETPWIYGRDFYRNKIFMRLGVLLESVKDVNSAVKVEGRKNEEDWKLLWDYDGSLCTFNYGTIDYRLFTYAGEPSCPDLSKKIKIKKAKRFKLRFSNDFIDQALILRQFGLDYVQEG
ncbi:MAG: hypothetical protein IKM48_08720 [Clostridia bacterium]|nr:hypothetical protein [Clostridia bacterium]